MLAFAVGVTGHRDIRPGDEAAAGERVRALLKTVKSELREARLEILTGLADGADRLVTRIALEEGIAVRAVLPMPRDLFMADFDAGSRDEFQRLLGRPGVTVDEIPLPPNVLPADVAAPGPARDRLYARLGDFLARRSNLLLALWDGKFNRKEGGTGEVVLAFLAAARRGATACDVVFARDGRIAASANIACWVPVGRAGGEPVAGGTRYLAATSVPGRLVEFDHAPPELIDRLRQMEALALGGEPAAGSGGLMASLPPVEEGALGNVLRAIDVEFRRADALAIANQAHSDRVFLLFALMAGLMAFLFLLYAKIAAVGALLALYLILFAAGFVIFYVMPHTAWFVGHLLHRAAAEMLRVRFFTTYAGVADRIDVHHLIALTGIENFAGFAWLSDVARVGEPLAYDSLAVPGDAAETVRKTWIEDQGRYFARRVHRLGHEHHRLGRIKLALFVASFLGALALLVFRHRLEEIGYGEHRDLATAVIFLMGLLPLWLGIWEIYQTKMATRELLWQYRNQARLFADATATIAASTSPEAKRAVIADLGERSLFETFLWTIHRFHREHEPPAAA